MFGASPRQMFGAGPQMFGACLWLSFRAEEERPFPLGRARRLTGERISRAATVSSESRLNMDIVRKVCSGSCRRSLIHISVELPVLSPEGGQTRSPGREPWDGRWGISPIRALKGRQSRSRTVSPGFQAPVTPSEGFTSLDPSIAPDGLWNVGGGPVSQGSRPGLVRPRAHTYGGVSPPQAYALRPGN